MAPSSDSAEDEKLLRAILDGDHAAFAELVTRHTRRFYAVSYRFTGNRSLAEDIVQEAFLKLWTNPTQWKPEKNTRFTTWFYRVIVNRTLDELRKSHPATGMDMERVADTSLSQDKKLEKMEQKQQLEEEIRRLPERQQTALNLCYMEEISNREAAEIMQVSPEALQSLLMRAKSTLRERMSAYREAI